MLRKTLVFFLPWMFAAACGPIDLGSHDAGAVTPTEGGIDAIAEDAPSEADAPEIDAPLPEPTITYVKASNARAAARFGIVAMDGDTMVVGSPYESSGSRGVDADQASTSAPNAGAAYVFRHVGNGWVQEAYLKASNARTNAYFGATVAIDGDRIAIGAIGEASNGTGKEDTSADAAGAVYLFQRTTGKWMEEAYLKASNARAAASFGSGLALEKDTLVVGSSGESSNATGVGGDANDTSAPGAGAAYVFGRTGNTWTQTTYVKASNTRADARFGASVTLENDTFVVGSIRESSAAKTVDGNQADTTAPGAGAAYVFGRSGNTWVQQAYLKASNTRADENLFSWFGFAVALSGDTLAVSAPIEASNARGVNGDQNDTSAVLAGAVYLYQRSGGAWSQTTYVKAPNAKKLSLFGYSLALSTNDLVVGAMTESSATRGIDGNLFDSSAPGSGAAFTFQRTNGVWAPGRFLKATNTRNEAAFGYSVARSGSVVVVGSVFETSGSVGIGGNAEDTSAQSAGAVYVYRL